MYGLSIDSWLSCVMIIYIPHYKDTSYSQKFTDSIPKYNIQKLASSVSYKSLANP